ncbi:MAG: N-acetylmannosamine-6-phosphate 2-epimerase [Clostridiaceae bacterium]|nr:N-acetylmannosamine-6-phosphate 2-epimerase [Clostridiaceae bacterium]
MGYDVLQKIRGGLIVSCQALEDEPLYSSYIMSKMARAAQLGGAKGIRANTVSDIKEIKQTVDLPIIGIVKQNYSDSEVFITPTEKEVAELVEIGCEIIAIDATKRMRPGQISLLDFFKKIRSKYPNQLFMADCSTYEEGIFAESLGFDLIGTTLCGYTSYTEGYELPNLKIIKQLCKDCKKPVIAEGGIWEPRQLKEVMDCGVLAAVVGTAITRPMEITRRFVNAIENRNNNF